MARFLEDFFANVFNNGSLEVETAGGRKLWARPQIGVAI
jgi:hypothetical protein